MKARECLIIIARKVRRIVPPWSERRRPDWLPPGAPWSAPTRRVAEPVSDYGTDPTWPRE